ncbi:hypothetical protein BEP19_00615 [Ammoniphilus oxalaticus]|uniref:Uncharacterized protein n=1 Tax=Ammoniphilus oxalaticus TaxID=66863 RepID=A0A419SRE9_9BACL|nr:hypothetical protein [Ammoniphilus oxalaticus]RKD27108.1 hypothetical protein BEP19_00615 [Ammoniphilus oxalaticus]
MTLFLLVGFIIVLILLFNKRLVFKLVRSDSTFVGKLSGADWFQNPWKSGTFLFVSNALLFSLTLLLIYVTGLLEIPFIHLFVMIAAVLSSLYLWIVIHKSWRGGRKERLLQGFVGSSFYGVLALIFIFMIFNMEPETPYNDNFMQFIGLVMGIFVAVVAFITCFCITSLTGKKQL